MPLPVVLPEDDDEEPVQEHAVLTVEHMDGLRIDRLALRLVTRTGTEPTRRSG